MEKNQSYRANAAALIVNTKGEFLLTQLVEARDNEWDFVKGGMRPGEEHLDTLKREIQEELGPGIQFQVLERSDVTIVYDWPQELQVQKGFRGQARISFWVLYKAGEITLNTDELRAYKWVPYTEVAALMQASHFPTGIIKSLMEEWEKMKQSVLGQINFINMSKYECEVKILEIDTESIKNRLHSLGAREIFNGHIVADFFRNSNGQKIRLRKMAGKNVLTYKIAYSTKTVLQNEEIEVVFDNYEGMVQVLLASGFELYGHSQKERVSYLYQNIHFDIDAMAGIPTFLEVEAINVEDVKRGVELLGYTMDQTCTLTERTLKEHYGLA